MQRRSAEEEEGTCWADWFPAGRRTRNGTKTTCFHPQFFLDWSTHSESMNTCDPLSLCALRLECRVGKNLPEPHRIRNHATYFPPVFTQHDQLTTSILKSRYASSPAARGPVRALLDLHPPSVCTQEAVADLVFLVDGSWSIGTENFDQIRQFLYTLVNSFDVSPDHVRVGLVQYSFTPRTEFQLNTFQDKKEILEYIESLPYSGGGTNTGKGLDFVLNKHFVESAGSRAAQSVPQIAVVITDGKSQDEVELHAERLRNKGIILYAIGIKDADADELKQIANRPYGQHVHSVSDFSALQGISQNIVQTLSNMADIVFLVDGSSSIGIPSFKQVRLFLQSIVSGLDIGPDKVRVGLAQYSTNPHKEFLLKEHLDAPSLMTAIQKFPYRTGGTNTGKAINFLISEYFTEEAGSRASQRVPQIAVVITDGDSSDNVTEPARRLREQGVIVFAIGVGKANLEELENIANQPSQRFLFTIDSYEALQRLTGGLLQTVCVSMEDQRQGEAESCRASKVSVSLPMVLLDLKQTSVSDLFAVLAVSCFTL
uniref:VWFA domain-containing protein n=1 Tax=Xiphophorus couchianus TaxID=32473 RepID=A0A3B5MVY3_9TELE